MLYKYGNRVYQKGNQMFRYSNAITMVINGLQWPGNYILFSGTAQQPFTITLNTGDGNTYSYASNSTGVLSIYNSANAITPGDGIYFGPVFSTNTNRTITIQCSNWNAIIRLTFRGMSLAIPQTLGIPFYLLPNLLSFSINSEGFNSMLLSLDESLFNLPKLNTLQFSGNDFYPNTRLYSTVVNEMLNPNLTTFAIGGVGYSLKSFNENGMNLINKTNLPNLTSLSVTQKSLTQNGFNSEGALPAEWYTLDKLERLNFNAVSFTSIPAQLKNFNIALAYLSFSYCSTLSTWNDLSMLTNLQSFSMTYSPMFTNTVPSWISSLTKLKAVAYSGSSTGNSVGWIDDLITNWYNMVVVNAAITGVAASLFRAMIFSINATTDQIPTGNLQRPSGYIQGTNNGLPVSSLERIWVLVNQYQHTWLYRAI